MSELQAEPAAAEELPPIPFGEPEVPAEPEPELEPEVPAEPGPELEPAGAIIHGAEAPPVRTVEAPAQDVQYVRINGSGGVRVTTYGGVQTKRVNSTNDFATGVSIHRDTLAEIHARLTADPPDVAAALLLLPPVPAG